MKYGFKTYKMKVEDHEFWVVESTELKGCVAQDDILDNAIKAFELEEQEWIDTAKEFKIKIPDQTITEVTEYSGKLSIRIAKSLHKSIAESSEKEGVSINTFVSNALSEKIGQLKGEVNVYLLNNSQTIELNNFNQTVKTKSVIPYKWVEGGIDYGFSGFNN